MRASYLLIFLLIFLSSCFTSQPSNERFFIDNRLFILDTPNPNLVEGVFINILDPTHDTLVLPPDMEFGPLFGIENIYKNQFFFLLTRDSLDKSIALRGTVNYSRMSYEGGDSTGYLTFEPEDRKTVWTCRVYLQDSTKRVKLLIIKDFYERKVRVNPFEFHLPGDPTKYYPKSIKLNSRGIPFRFVRKIFLEN